VWPIFGLSADCYWQPVITDEMIRLLWGTCSAALCMAAWGLLIAGWGGGGGG
jgi:hypothetical protein